MTEEKKKVNEYSLVEVPTQMGLAFETPEGEVLTTEQLLVKIANELREVKKGVLGQ